MLTVSNLYTLSRNPILPKTPPSPLLLSNRFPCFRFQIPRPFSCFCFQKPPMSSSSAKIVAEYAKSNRSSCKKCAKTISAKDLRLGLVSRDSRGFDMTRWHHLDCFPMGSQSVSSAEAVKGFASLKSSDQEALKKLVAQSDKSVEEISDGSKDVVEGSKEKSSKQLRVHKIDEDEKNERKEGNSKKAKISDGSKDGVEGSKEKRSKQLRVHKTDEDEKNELEEGSSKKTKLSTPDEEDELDIAFSVSDIKNKYKDATLLPKWKAFQTLIFLERVRYRTMAFMIQEKLRHFDFDGCLVKTSVKRVGPDAWSLMYPSIPDRLQSLYNDGYKLVIFTNESNIERWKNKRQIAVDSKIGRLNNFIKRVKVPIQVFIACGLGKSGDQAEDPFRKPKSGMWRIMEQHFNSGILIDMKQSFYVGDAAGRENDHSDADIKFAEAIGLKFYVP
ncbi:hypothetical protein L1049_000852 [Liquidambar formosana]|uniref:PARP-type domain-containing protein n=1 Tax=Liquidambar formosana TaxID=63359 RepID=A0AAP0R5Q8_LIQFO